MTHWKAILQDSITTYSALQKHLDCNNTALKEVIANFPMRINPYFLNLIKTPHDPLWKQSVPDPAELDDAICIDDPLDEENLSPVPNLVHRYPDRALFLVTNQCAMYCRFCTRKRKVGTSRMCISADTINAGLDYLTKTPEIKDVLISGGDPLLLDDEVIDTLLLNLRKIPSIEVIRIGTRVPCSLPMRITGRLVAILRKYHPLYINTHFNHPAEITPEATRACALLADSGIPLGCQTVLLRGINDDPAVILALMRGLLRIRVKPYYLFQADLTRGTNHFRTHTDTGVAILRHLIGKISGMAIPTLALDAPGGKGKIPLSPDFILERGKNLIFNSYCGKVCTYPEAGEAF
ncbi:MAG: KamA family radical SAM protein [Desulfocapsaceae bacterium]|nr:KamA family radical SAM protein [Desulfocapsaceae bacterium]